MNSANSLKPYSAKTSENTYSSVMASVSVPGDLYTVTRLLVLF